MDEGPRLTPNEHPTSIRGQWGRATSATPRPRRGGWAGHSRAQRAHTLNGHSRAQRAHECVGAQLAESDDIKGGAIQRGRRQASFWRESPAAPAQGVSRQKRAEGLVYGIAATARDAVHQTGLLTSL